MKRDRGMGNSSADAYTPADSPPNNAAPRAAASVVSRSTGVGIARSMASAVPQESRVSPAPVAPAPAAPQGWSWTDTVSTAPASSGILVTRPAAVPASTRTGMDRADSPAHSRPVDHQPRVVTSRNPVRDASESSATSSPPSQRTIHSATLSQRRPRPGVATPARSDAYFAMVQADPNGNPVCRANSAAPISARSEE